MSFAHFLPLRKHAYVIYCNIIHGCKNDIFHMKNCDILFYCCSKHRSWVHVRTTEAVLRRF